MKLKCLLETKLTDLILSHSNPQHTSGCWRQMPCSLGSAMLTQTSPHRDADLQMKETPVPTQQLPLSPLFCASVMEQQALNFLPLASSPHTHNLLAVCLTLQRGRWHPLLNPWPKLCKASEAWHLETDGTTHRETENHQDHTCPQAHTVTTPCATETLLTAFPVSQSSPRAQSSLQELLVWFST